MLIKSKAIYVNERMLMDDWNSGYMTYKDLGVLLQKADIHFVADNDDPQPWKMYQFEIRKRRVINCIKNIMSLK